MDHVCLNERAVSQRAWAKTISRYLLAALLSIAVLAVVLRLWRADLRLPFMHHSDTLFTAVFINGIIENGWYLTNPRLGAPFGTNFYDFPMSDTLHFLGFRLLSSLSSNWAVVLNLYFLLTFPLTTLTALFVFRRFGCAYLPSLVGSLLFTFLPYHFLRGEIHLFLAAYYMVPLLILWILEVFLDLPVFGQRMSPATGLRWLRLVGRLLLCVAAASTGVYYTFFACFLLLVAGFCCWYRKRTWNPLLKSVALVTVLGIATGLNLAPNVLYQSRHGRNPQSFQREPGHAEVFGLKLVQLLLPVTDHRLALFQKIKARYNEAFRSWINENDLASLGAIGSVGLLLALGTFLSRKPRRKDWRLREALAMLCLACLLLCTIGGLGSLVSLFVTANIRCYNRVSVYIAFFSLFTMVLAAERMQARLHSRPAKYAFSGLLLPVLLIGGIWDQTTKRFVPPYSWVRQEFTSDEAFIRNIEANLPEGAMVFQLPYACFPEAGQICQMADYDHLRGYLHSRHLRWSYGSYKGRASDAWLKEVSSKPVEELVREVARAGFSGIYIDRSGYPDAAKELEGKLSLILQAPPLVSPNRLLAFFDFSRCYGPL
jgi:hypothetical protein